MKLTTKIVLGIIAAIFLLSLIFIIGFSFTDRVNENNERPDDDISQENITPVEVKPYKTIWLDETRMSDEYNVHPTGNFKFRPLINPEDENKLFLPEELLQFADFISSNDTLIIRLKTKEIHDKYSEKKNEKKYLIRQISGFNFSANINAVNVISNLDIKIDVKNITTDKISINTRGEIVIDSCKADIIEPITNCKLKLKNSQVKELNIDLDVMGNFEVENCNIEVENLTGGKYHHVQQPKSEARTVNWLPKNKEARLQVLLLGDTARIVFP